MNSFHDISTPKFKQLEKIRNISTDNIEVTEAEHVQTQAWEPTAKRMYQLSLTDGCQNVLAIENKPIKILNVHRIIISRIAHANNIVIALHLFFRIMLEFYPAPNS